MIIKPPDWRVKRTRKLETEVKRLTTRLAAQQEAARSEVTAKDNEIAELKSEVADLKSNIDELESTIHYLTKDNEQLLSDMQDKVYSMNSDCRSRVRVVQEAAQRKDRQISKLKAAVASTSALKDMAVTQRCHNPNFTALSTTKRWADKTNNFLVASHVGSPQKKQIYTQLLKDKGVACVEQDVYKQLKAAKDLSEANQSRLRWEGAVLFRDRLEEYWTASRFINLRVARGISYRAQQFIYDSLLKCKDPTTGKCSRLKISIDANSPPIKTPKFQSRYLQNKQIDDAAAKFDVKLLGDGEVKGAMADYKLLLKGCLESRGEAGLLTITDGLVKTASGAVHTAAWAYDGHMGYKGQKLVNFSLRLLPCPDDAPHALRHLRHFLIFEGSDKNLALHSTLSDVLGPLNSFIGESEIECTANGCSCRAPLRHVLVSDAVALQENYGLAGGLASHTCPWCYCPRNQHFSSCVFDRRTLQDTQLLAHMAAGTCPGCGFTILSKADWERTKAKDKKSKRICCVAQRGDEVPSSLRAAVKKVVKDQSFLQVHKGVDYGSEVVLKIPPKDAYACIMHGNCCIVGMLVDASIFKAITSYHARKADKADTLCEQIATTLGKLGINISKVVPASTSISTWYNSLTTHRFAGRDSSIMLAAFSSILPLVYPQELRDSDIQARKKYEDWMGVWTYYRDSVWKVLCDLTITQSRRAELIAANAVTFNEKFVGAHAATGHLYPHFMAHHYPEQILSYDGGLWELQLQSVESLNQWVKRREKSTTNGMKRTETLDVAERSFKRRLIDGTSKTVVVSAHTRSSGPTRTEQIMRLSAVNAQSHNVILANGDDNRIINDGARIRSATKKAAALNLTKKLVQEFDSAI